MSERVSSLLDDATYADGACDYDRAQRRCRNRRNVEAVQPAGHRRFSFLTPLPICGRNNSALGVLGHPDLDGHKLVCGLATLAKASRRRPAVVFSLGSNNNFVFEQAVVRRLGRHGVDLPEHLLDAKRLLGHEEAHVCHAALHRGATSVWRRS